MDIQHLLATISTDKLRTFVEVCDEILKGDTPLDFRMEGAPDAADVNQFEGVSGNHTETTTPPPVESFINPELITLARQEIERRSKDGGRTK